MVQNSFLKDALKGCQEALQAAVAKCYIANAHETEDIDMAMAMAKLKKAEQPFHSALKNGREYCSMRINQIRELGAALQRKAVDPDTDMELNSLFKDGLQSWEKALQDVVAECNTPSELNLIMANLKLKHELLHLASKYATELCDMRIQEIRDQQAALTKETFPNTAELPPFKPNYANPRSRLIPVMKGHSDLGSEAQHGDVDNMLEECNKALSRASAEVYKLVELNKNLLDLRPKVSVTQYGNVADIPEECNMALSQALAELYMKVEQQGSA